MLRYQCQKFLHQYVLWVLIYLTSCYEMKWLISLCQHFQLCYSKTTMCAFTSQAHAKLWNLSSSVELESWIRVFNYYFNFSAIRLLFLLFNYTLPQERRLGPDWSPYSLLEGRLHPHTDWSLRSLLEGRLHPHPKLASSPNNRIIEFNFRV